MHTDPTYEDPIFGKLIHSYTAAEAARDGVIVDARNLAEIGEVSRQHFPPIGSFTPGVYMTQGLFQLIEKAVDNPRSYSDWRGVWHDVCYMAKVYALGKSVDAGTKKPFPVVIIGAGRQRKYELFVAFDGQNFTFLLPGED